MKKIFISILLVGLVGCVSTSKNVIAPEGWRIADQEDDIDDWARFDSPNKIIDDFNGDKKADIAQILLKQDSKNGFKFVVDMNYENKIQQFQLVEMDGVNPQSVSIELLKPSDELWESACSKGYWDCEPNEIRQFKIVRPSIQFCYIESACTVFMWSDRNHDFIKVPLSD